MPENYKIDYGNLPHDIQLLGERVRQTAQNFRDSVDEQFPEIRIKQEQEKIRQEEKEKIDRLPWHSKLGYHLMTVPQDGTLPLYTRSAADRMMVGDFAGAEAIQKPVNTVGAIATGMGLLGAAGLADLIATAGTYGLGTALAAEGLSWGTGTAGYYGGNWLGQKIDNKHGTNITPWLSILTSIGGGAAGYSGVLRSSPSMIKRMLNEAKKMDWTPEGIVIPDKAPKWNWSSPKNASYDGKTSTLNLPLFARKSQIGHELGHYVGDVNVADPTMVKGAFTEGYEYAPGVEFERNAAENFADYFKTKLGYPYTGKNANLVARQIALQNKTAFDDVVRADDRLYELPLAERMGIPKGDRANLTQDQLEGLEDLMHYNTNGKYRWHLTYNDETGFARTTAANRPEGSVPGVKALLDHGATSRGYENAPVDLRTKTGSWTIWPSRKNSPAKFSGGDFPTPEGMGWAPGDLSLMLDGNTGKGLKVVMTSPRVDLANSLEDASQSLIESLPNTIDKNIMRRFWQNNDQVVLPGSYLSGDNGTLPLGLSGISAIDQGKGMSGAISEILHPTRFRPHASGLSPDSMLSILKQGQRPKHAVRYGPGFTQLNDSAVYNKHIYDAWTKYKSGAITADEFKTIFDDWFVPQGGRPLEIKTPSTYRWAKNNDGTKSLVANEQKPYIVFPHPYVHYKEEGGKIK